MNLRSVQNLTQASWLAIHNTANDADTAKKLSAVGFNDKRLREIENLTKMVEDLENTKIASFHEGLRVSEQIEKEVQSLRPLFMDHVAGVRYAFRNEPALVRTFLPKPVAPNKWGWLPQARHMYTHITPYAEQLAMYGIALEDLEQAKASVEAIIRLREDRMLKKGIAEDCTDSRNQMVKQLKSLLKEFHAAAKLALKDNPQKLEAFGIRVRSLQK